MNTSTSRRASALAAFNPANPAPMMTTRGFPGSDVSTGTVIVVLLAWDIRSFANGTAGRARLLLYGSVLFSWIQSVRQGCSEIRGNMDFWGGSTCHSLIA